VSNLNSIYSRFIFEQIALVHFYRGHGFYRVRVDIILMEQKLRRLILKWEMLFGIRKRNVRVCVNVLNHL